MDKRERICKYTKEIALHRPAVLWLQRSNDKKDSTYQHGQINLGSKFIR